MAKFFDFAFPLHSSTAATKKFSVGEPLGFVDSGVSGAFPIRMLFGALVEVFGVPCVEATIHTLQNVNIEGHV